MWLLAAAVITITTGCKKEEGEGGRSSISGRVIEQEMHSCVFPDSIKHEQPRYDERIYIVYGDQSEVYDDDMRTDYLGRFHFQFLRKGTYTIFTYGECNPILEEDCLICGGDKTIIQTIELGKNEDLVIDDIIVQNY